MFIEITDVTKQIRAEELTAITRGDDTLVYYGIDAAVAEAKSYLSKLFDTDKIFNQTGSSRNALLVNFIVDIAIYIIVSTALPGQDLEDRRARYKRAIDWLKQVKTGDISSDLPQLTNEIANSRGAIGTHTKRNNYF